jgi:hypothetical protein
MPNLDEQEVKSYLLGSLSPERQTELQTLFDRDAELREELFAVEEELFDQYVEGCLSADEKQLFETHLLSTADRQRKLQFAELFGRYRTTHEAEESATFTCAPAPNAPIFASSPYFVSFNRNPAFAVLLIVATGLLLGLVGWLILAKPPAPQQAATHSGTETMVLTLAPVSTRSTGGIRHLSAPPDNVHVKLELELAKSDYKRYQTQLFRENQALESQAELKTEPKNNHYVVPVTVTGEMLRPGDYQLKLSGVLDSGQPAFIDSYSFRITPDEPSDPDQERRRIVR